MKKTVRLFLTAVFVTAIFVGCGKDDPRPKGDAGDPGNDGIIKRGFFEGTVSGIRNDGTAFNEDFKYENIKDSLQEGYTKYGDAKLITFERSMGEGRSLKFSLKSTQEGVFEPQSIYSNSIYFAFIKELSQDNLFKISASPFFEDTKAFVRQISFKENQAYQFSIGYQYYNYPTEEITINNSNKYVYHIECYYLGIYRTTYYSVDTGALVAVKYFKSNTSVTQTTGPVFDFYNKLKFKKDEKLGISVFYTADTDVPLYEEVPDVSADKLIISNYNKDVKTGVISFSFELKISKHISYYYRQNSTGHDLTIKGKFNSGGKVYESISGRLPG